MKNPWSDVACFDAMFTDAVEITATRSNGSTIKGTFSACVYPPTKEDAFAEFDAESSIMKLTFLLSKKGEHGWNKNTKLQIGDEVKLIDTSQWKVSSVVERLEYFEVEAKSC